MNKAKPNKEDLKVFKIEYMRGKSITDIFHDHKKDFGWTSRSNADYWIKKSLSEITNLNEDLEVCLEEYKFETNEDLFWLGYLHSIKNLLVNKSLKIPKFKTELNDWYNKIQKDHIWNNNIKSTVILDELNKIVLKKTGEYLNDLDETQRNYFIAGYFYFKFEIKTLPETIVLPGWLNKIPQSNLFKGILIRKTPKTEERYIRTIGLKKLKINVEEYFEHLTPQLEQKGTSDDE